MTRSLEELTKIPLAVVLDHELPVLFEYCKETQMMIDVMTMILKGRGLEDKHPEWHI